MSFSLLFFSFFLKFFQALFFQFHSRLGVFPGFPPSAFWEKSFLLAHFKSARFAKCAGFGFLRVQKRNPRASALPKQHLKALFAQKSFVDAIQMMLDSNSFKTQLSPEVAMGIIQKACAKKGWKKIEVQQIRLVYSPFYLFSFDVSNEGAQPVSGKTAMNAFTGEMNDFVPMLFDRPLSKTKDTGDAQAEIEPSSISLSEAKGAAQAKVAAQLGVKKDGVTVSGLTKFYAPFYRVWVNVADDQFKIYVDACLGAPTGLDAIPARQNTWDEETAATFEKMKSPSGWADLAGRVASGAGKAGADSQKTGPGGLKPLWIILLIAIIAFFALGMFGGKAAENSCTLDKKFIEEKTVWLFSKETKVNPASNPQNKSVKFVEGTCSFLNKAKAQTRVCQRQNVFATIAGTEVLRANNFTDAFAPAYDPSVNQTIVKAFRIEWEETGSQAQKYAFKSEAC